MSYLSLSFLGTFQVQLNNQPVSGFRSAKVQGLFIYLVLEAARAHSRDVLATLFWPDEPDVTARKNLRQSLYQLRQVLPDKDLAEPFFLITRTTVQFNQKAHYTLDVAEFDQYVKQNQPEQASQLYEDTLLPGFTCASEPFEDWLRLQREQRHRQGLSALSAATAGALAKEDTTRAQMYVQRQLQLEPWREEAHQQLMMALYLAGEKAAALRQYEQCCDILEEELGISPGADTQALYEQIRNKDSLPKTGSKPTPSAENKNESGPIQPLASIPDLYTTLSRLDPLPDQKLFGVDSTRQIIEAKLSAEAQPWLVAIDGMGGVGKTALATAVAHHFVEQKRFYDIAWVSAKQDGLTPNDGWPHSQPAPIPTPPTLDSTSLIDSLLEQLSPETNLSATSREKRAILTVLLKHHSYLIIIDNLETVTDYQTLLPFLRLLSKPSKFLITSRFTLRHSSDVFSVGLNELNQQDSLALLRYEAEARGIEALSKSTNQQLHEIYYLIGGNPLALKLLVGQIGFVPLIQILQDLTERKAGQSGTLYHYLYHQSWHMLDEPAQQILMTLLTNPNGTFNRLQTITALSGASLQQALVYLTALSLVNLRGDLDEPRYYLHRLTETFLLQEIIGWQQQTPSQAVQTSSSLQGNRQTNPIDHWRPYFQTKIQDTLTYWRNQQGLINIDVPFLSQERDDIVQALFFGLDVPEAWSVTRDLAIAFTPYMERRGHWEIWNRFLIQAIEQAKLQQDQNGQLTLTSLLARLYQRQSRPNQVIYYYRRVIRLAQQVGNQFEMARACSNLGYAYIDLGNWWRSEVLCQRALQIFEELESEHGQAHTHNHLGLLYTRQRHWEKAKNHLDQACAVWQKMGDDWGLIYGFMNVGLLYIEMEQGDEVLAWSEKALQQAETAGEEIDVATIHMNMGIAYRLMGNAIKAEACAKRADAIFQRHLNIFGIAQVQDNFGLIYMDQQKWDEADAHFQAALQAWQKQENEFHEIQVMTYLVAFEAAKGDTTNMMIRLEEVDQRIAQINNDQKYQALQARLTKYRHTLAKQPVASWPKSA